MVEIPIDPMLLIRSSRRPFVNSLVVANRGTYRCHAELSEKLLPSLPAVPLQGLSQVFDVVSESLFHRILRFPAEIFLGAADVEVLGA
jgi:hypothetical protein